MTNVEIIMANQMELVKNGIIKEDEEIHTYQMWHDLWYQVKKGEHAIAKFTIWKPSKGKVEEDENGKQKVVKKPYMFMKSANFFSTTQVEPIS